jgi:hypothetical protein
MLAIVDGLWYNLWALGDLPHLFNNNLRRFNMAVNIDLHRVTNVTVEESKMDRDDGTTWFVTKNIIIKDDSDEAVLKVTLFADDFDQLKFNTEEV